MAGHGHHHKRFSPDQLEKLHDEQRRKFQPPEPVVSWAAGRMPSRVLDVGVGIGYFAIPLAKALPDARIIALDVEPKMLAALDKRLDREGLAERVDKLMAAADEGPGWGLEAQSVDLVLAINMLHELDYPEEFARRVSEVLAPRGALLVVDWRPDAAIDEGPPRQHRLSEQKAAEIFGTAGLEVIERPVLYTDFYSIALSMH
ncbi:MAG: methyltransferase domain-containing protein [Deltaproteobacteria bacterium]|nr:MAG: methyltransferase domain-containing protein [Deltaproteobacteria bacterium]